MKIYFFVGELTDHEIQAVNRDMELIIQHGDDSHNLLLLNLLKGTNSQFDECVSDESKRRRK